MALGITVLATFPLPGTQYRGVLAEVAFDSSYAAGGEDISSANTNRPLGTVVGAIQCGVDTSAYLHAVQLDFEAQKLVVLNVSAQGSGDLSTHRYRIIFITKA